MASAVRVWLDKESEARTLRKLYRLLEGSRRQAPAVVKFLGRAAANSAAKMTIPNTGRNMPDSSVSSSVRRPKMADKFRPVVRADSVLPGKFYIVNNAKRSQGGKKNKKRSASKGITRSIGDRRVMKGSQGETVIYTTKPISQKDTRFKKVTSVIQAWDKKKNGFYYIPTRSNAKHDKKSPKGKIPWFFAAKQAWLHASSRLQKMPKLLNKHSRLRSLGRMINNLHRQDKPSIRMYNLSNYAQKSGGTSVPRRALIKAYRAYMNMMRKPHKRKIINRAKRG